MSTNYLPQSYDRFRPLVADIKAKNSAATFLGGGAESSVWQVALDEAYYAVKFTKEFSTRGRRRDVPRATERKIVTGLRGLGIVGLEQFQTGSVEDGVTIYDYVDATKVAEMSEESTSAVTKEHVSKLWRTVALATQVGIEFDGWNSDGDNVFFDDQSGFTLIDYWVTDANVSFESNRSNVVMSLGQVGLKLVSIL